MLKKEEMRKTRKESMKKKTKEYIASTLTFNVIL